MRSRHIAVTGKQPGKSILAHYMLGINETEEQAANMQALVGNLCLVCLI